jgi:hypothetical protein
MSLSDIERLRLLQPPTGRVRAVLDTDTYNEVDDQFALVQTILSPDRIKLEAIYAAPFQNQRSTGPGHGMDLSYDEILRLLGRLGHSADGFAFRGVRDYVGPEKKPRDAEAVDDLINRSRSSSLEDPLYVIAIGAISNVASAILKAPEIIDRIVLIWLGGNPHYWPQTRDFNLRQDVGAAQVIFDSGVPVVQVPNWGVTSHMLATVPEIERYVEPSGPVGQFLAMRFKEYESDHLGWSKELWDMAPVGWLLNADWAPSTIVHSPVLNDNMTWSVDNSRHLIRCVDFVYRDKIFKDFYEKLARFSGVTL